MTGCGCEVLPSVRVGCCCLPLRCAAIVIGLVYEFLSVSAMFVFGAAILKHRSETKELDSTIYFFFTILLSMILQFVAGLFLLFATIKKSPNWMTPWIYVSFVQCAGLIGIAVLCTFAYIYQVTSGETRDNPDDALNYAVYAIYGFVLYYATAVVYSYQKQLHAERLPCSDNDGAEMAPLSSA